MDQPHVNGSPHPAFIQINNFKPTLHPIKFVDTLFPVYNQKKGGHQNMPSLISTEDLMKWSNEKVIELGMGDTFYPIFFPLTMN